MKRAARIDQSHPLPLLRVLSLGAGVQSTALALMAASGEFSDRIDCAIFADTKWEPADIYRHVEWLETVLPFPIYRVTSGDIRSDILQRRNTTGGRFASVPWFIANPDGTTGMGRRQCSPEYKLKPIMHKLRELLGASRRGRIRAGAVEVWIGISREEAVTRMKDARQKYIVNRWPLVERRMTRNDCSRWLETHGYPTPPKSACIGCPFHDQKSWQRMRDHRPDEFAQACDVDAALRIGNARGMHGLEFMHPARIPLREAVALAEGDQSQGSLFDHECEGHCGV